MNTRTLQWLQRSHIFFRYRGPHFTLMPITMAFVLASLCTLLFLAPFLAQLQTHIPSQYSLQVLLVLVLWLLNCGLFILLSVPGLPLLQRFLLSSLFLNGAISHYFIRDFGIVIDRAMLQNVLETDIAEASGLLHAELILSTLGWLLFLGWLQRHIQFKAQHFQQSAKQWLLALLLVFSGLGVIASTHYAELASFFRNYRVVKFYALPISPLVAGIAVTKQQLAAHFPPTFQVLSTDVRNQQPAAAPRTLVLVLGETARADHFQLNGYPRASNPRLSQLPVVSFSEVSSCGTATAHSVPCIFPIWGENVMMKALLKIAATF